MPRRVRLVHTIAYRFEPPAERAELELRLTPRALPSQRLDHHHLATTPSAPLAQTEDPHGNVRHTLRLDRPFASLELSAVSTVTQLDRPEPPAAARALLDRCGIRHGPGNCRAVTEAALAQLRAHAISCRYVAGYLVPPTRARTLPHAWLRFELPGHGWLDFDATTGELAPAHVTLAWGDGYDDVAPVAGPLLGTGRYHLRSTVTVDPLSSLDV